MINYSISMKVAENVTEVNKAKSRIAAAKKAQQEPAAEDVELVENAVMKAYGSFQVKETLDLEKFAEHITSHGCVYSKGDILAILTMACDCIREQVLAGNRVNLGDLGTFWLRMTQKPADSLAEYNPSINIKSISGCWTPSSRLKGLVRNAEYNLVTNKKTTSAVIKAQKHGVPTVKI